MGYSQKKCLKLIVFLVVSIEEKIGLPEDKLELYKMCIISL